MAKTVYSVESEVWKLYEKVEGRTRQILDDGSCQFPGSEPKPDDVVIESGGIRLVGAYGYSGLVYNWDSLDDWILVTFRSEPPVPFDRYGDLLQILENHYGVPTRAENNNLFYEIVIGKREIRDTYSPGNVDEKTEPIIRTLILGIDAFSFMPEKDKR
ncbi:MAG: hypothetical protein KAS90_00155 [Candidatus Aenigmarchaeota archaeon]|nr:hypothetical protein [Candidatus Aenigmarchaeota archaeon]